MVRALLVRIGTRHCSSSAARGALLAVAVLSLNVVSGLAQAPVPRWEIASSPLLVIGTADGSSQTLFESIVGVRALPDGGIAVADGGLLNLRVFSASGEFLTQMGREGRGPGEFRDLRGFWLTSAGDLAVWDSENRRITTFSIDGKAKTSNRLRSTPNGANLEPFFGAMPGDKVLVGALSPISPVRGTFVINPWRLFIYDISGRFVGEAGAVRGMLRHNGHPHPFTPVPWVALVHDTLVVSDGFEPRVEMRTPSGSKVRDVAVGVAQEATNADWRGLEQKLRESGGNKPITRLFLQILGDGRMREESRRPVVAGLVADQAGFVWVKRYSSARDALWLKPSATRIGPGGTWMVLDLSDGRVVAEVRLPEEFTLMEVLNHRVLGVWTDPVGVQRVAAYQLRRGQ